MIVLKRVVVIVSVSLFLLVFSAYSENANNVSIDCVIDSNDTALNNIIKLYQHFQTNDGKGYEVIDGIVDKNVVWKYDGVSSAVPFAGTFMGKNGVRNFWSNYFNAVIVQKAQLRYYLHQENIIHLHWTDEGIVKSTGKKYLMETVQRYEFNDKGKLVKFRWYNDTFALYQAFQPNTDPQLSLAQHPADYNINGDGPVDALPIAQDFYKVFLAGDIPTLLSKVSANNAFILAGPESIVPHAGTWIGPQGMVRFFTALLTNEQFQYINLLTFTADGCRVDVEFKEEMLVYATGKVVDNEGMHSMVINTNGQMAKFRSYNNTYILAWGCTN